MPDSRAGNSPRGLRNLSSYDRYSNPKWGYNDAKHHNAGRHVGEEPGVNPHSLSAGDEYGHFKEDCIIDVIDYDSDEATFRRMGNTQFIEFMGEKPSDADGLPPRAVRWINIAGIDWDVLSATAVRYNLHALSLEDILHEQGSSQSKADYYLDHLFIRVVTHFLHADGILPLHLPDLALPSIDDLEQGSHQQSSNFPGKTGQKKAKWFRAGISQGQNSASRSLQNSLARRMTLLSGLNGPAREAHMREIEALKDSFVKVIRDPMFIFLRHDGVVISIHPSRERDYCAPIQNRIHKKESVLRVSEDASLLVQSLLDLVVDRILEVVDEYQVKIHKLERDILLRPSMADMHRLHFISGELFMHKRMLDPIKTMIFGLRKYDLERMAALAESMAADPDYESASGSEASLIDHPSTKAADGSKQEEKRKRKRKRQRERALLRKHLKHAGLAGQGSQCGVTTASKSPDHNDRLTTLGDGRWKGPVRGYFSFKAKVYLADVYDHIDFAISSLEMFGEISENLISFAFNTASYDMNETMKRLTIVTLIFLPLTLMTGYFGMNFNEFWSVREHSDWFFWQLAIPLMGIVVPLFMFDDIVRFMRYLVRQYDARQARKKENK